MTFLLLNQDNPLDRLQSANTLAAECFLNDPCHEEARQDMIYQHENGILQELIGRGIIDPNEEMLVEEEEFDWEGVP